MPSNELIMLDSLALSVVFPDKTPLERLFLGFLLANTASQSCVVNIVLRSGAAGTCLNH
ncbi:hypothetical protein PSI23_21515 [Xenorhabdus sp. XENO-10]|uniref:Transposase n=1 Tax=Xenorhabdus yunnanensis TaxID=3025878 RepID=A0ABT5LL00_9GAMM|nr:hypothetical protein [Xenorhabdus yunnanensis]MDC9591784.1 hypothetical protein [Xenorhabdus yunnanensis]